MNTLRPTAIASADYWELDLDVGHADADLQTQLEQAVLASRQGVPVRVRYGQATSIDLGTLQLLSELLTTTRDASCPAESDGGQSDGWLRGWISLAQRQRG